MLSADEFLGREELALAFWPAAGGLGICQLEWLGDVWRERRGDVSRQLSATSDVAKLPRSHTRRSQCLVLVGRLWHHFVALGAGSCPSRRYPPCGDCRKAGGICTSELLRSQG